MSPNATKPEPRAQELLSDFQRGVRAVLIGPPGSGKGTQVNKLLFDFILPRTYLRMNYILKCCILLTLFCFESIHYMQLSSKIEKTKQNRSRSGSHITADFKMALFVCMYTILKMNYQSSIFHYLAQELMIPEMAVFFGTRIPNHSLTP